MLYVEYKIIFKLLYYVYNIIGDTKMKDLTGKKFNKWTVLNFVSGKQYKYYWKCQCECGAIHNVAATHLTGGKSRQCVLCGQKSLILDLNGQIFGKWTVIKRLERRGKRGSYKWYCKCECGYEGQVDGSALLRGKSKSCRTCYKGKYIIYPLYIRMISRARSKGFIVNISMEYLEKLLEKQNYKCALTGQDISPLRRITHNIKPTASIDRIDSSKGYIEGNVQWVHKDINRLKGSLTSQEFINLCQLVTIFHSNILYKN